MNKISKFVNSVPKPVRDFIESLVSAGIVGAAANAFLASSDPNIGAKAAVVFIAKGFVDAVLAASRRSLPTAN